MATPHSALIDIDGVLTVSWQPLPGAVDALRRLREYGVAVRLVTNTTSRTLGSIHRTLSDAGFDIRAGEILTAASAAADYLARHYPGARCMLLNSGDISADLPGIRLVADDPDVVLLGGAGPEFDYTALNRVFDCAQRGIPLVAIHRSLSWRTQDGLRLDTGAFLCGIERAAQCEAVVVGKPSGEFFTAALRSLGTPAESTVMVGDDIESDVLAAQRLGITGILVRTGKYTLRTHAATAGEPDHVLDSVADVPALLGATAQS